MTMTKVSVSLTYSEYLTLMDSLRNSRELALAELRRMRSICEDDDRDEGLRGHALNVIKDCECDMKVLEVLEEKIRAGSKAGGLE